MKNYYTLFFAAIAVLSLFASNTQAQTKTLITKQDTYIANTTAGRTIAYGTTDAGRLFTRYNDFNFKRKAYIQFDLAGLQEADFNNVTLRLYGGMNSMDDDVTVYIHPLPNDTWNETTLTWDTRPDEKMSENPQIDSVMLKPAEYQYYEWTQLGPYLKAQFMEGKTIVSFRIENSNSFSRPEVYWNSKEATENRPQLIFSSSVTGINKIEEASLSLYPNPATTDLRIQLDSKYKTTAVEIYNIQGQKVISASYDATNKNNYLNITNLSSGAYTIRLIGNDFVATRKFIKL